MPPTSSTKKLLLIGASRGLGLALAGEYLERGWHVVATERAGAHSKLHDLMRRADSRLEIEAVDINDPDQVAGLRARLASRKQNLVVPSGTIGIMTSGQGSISNNESGRYEVYRGSKAALNMFVRSFAARHADDPRTLLLMAPGWVRTDMGGPQAHLSIEESIPKLADTMDAQAGKGGLQYLDYLGRKVPW